jgi:hypothetical protein
VSDATWDYVLEQLGRLRERVDRLERNLAQLDGGRSDDDDAAEDLETAGNLICLPGVKLANVKSAARKGPSAQSDDPGPSAA